jgi:hypothetical protein
MSVTALPPDPRANIAALRSAVVGTSLMMAAASALVNLSFGQDAVPGLGICAGVFVIGLIMIWFDSADAAAERSAGWGEQPPEEPSELVRALLLIAAIGALIGCAFYYSQKSPSGTGAWVSGLASALLWGLSVVGALFWKELGVFSTVRWNAWLNLFAAGSAALTVGYSVQKTIL